jgi:hypothetical protein
MRVANRDALLHARHRVSLTLHQREFAAAGSAGDNSAGGLYANAVTAWTKATISQGVERTLLRP